MDLLQQLPVLVIALPLSGALLCTFLSRIHPWLGKGVLIASLTGSFVSALGLVVQTVSQPGISIHYAMGNWEAPIGIEFVVDPLNALLATFISGLALATAFYCLAFQKRKHWVTSGGFYTLIGLLNVGLCGMTLTGDVFNLYVFLEVASISGYGLIALGGKKSVLAAFRYLLVGTIGASFYLIAIGLLYAMTGTLNMADLSLLLQGQMDNPLVILACASLIASFGIKMSIFPFHVWQPDAYSYAHPGASPLISGAMSKVPAFAMIRFFYFIFGVQHWVVDNTLLILGIIGAIGMIAGSIMALAQTDFRRMLAYSSIAQLGYIALGIGLGNFYGVAGGFLHILNHILMKGGLFLVIGAIQYRFGIVDYRQFGQLHKKMPLTCLCLVIAAMSMIGIPPTGGFFSKWYLLMGAMEAHMYPYIAVLIVSSLLNAFYFLRVLEHIFITPASPATDTDKAAIPRRLELPLPMLIPILLFALGILAMGFLNSQVITSVITPALQGVL